MQAVRLSKPEKLDVAEVGEPRPSAGEIIVRVGAAFVCGTDLRMYRNGNPHVAEGGSVTLGHEIAGYISEVGSTVTAYEPGMRVTVDPNMGCGVCDYCVSGNTQLCPQLRAIGIHLDGGFAEYVRIPAAAVQQGNVVRLPEHVTLDEAALVEPLSCVYNAAERCRTIPGDTVLVIGAGPIGLMHAKMHRMLGAGRIIVHDIKEERLALCRRLQPDLTTVGREAPEDRIQQESGGRGADVTIVAAPSPEAQQLALRVTRINGRVVFFGGLPKSKEEVTLNSNLIHYRQLWVTGTTRQNLRHYRTTLNLIAAGQLTVRDLISSRFRLEDAQQAFEAAGSGQTLKIGFAIGGE
ncbi:MAG: alcohol dehydrogenase catalytic domain-containing protein [Spirochaetaceae bacterium]